jgi:PAS domain S-box-containing protein
VNERLKRAHPDRVRPQAVALVDDRERVLEWSHGATSIFGYTREEAIGEDLATLIIPGYRLDEHRRLFASLVDEPDPHLLTGTFETVAKCSDGVQIRIEAGITRTAVEPYSFMLSISDLSEDCAHDPGQGQLETMFEHSDDAIATLAIDGTITSWNRAAAALYEFSADEAVGRRMSNLLVPGGLIGEARSWLTTVADGRPVEERTRRRRRDGRELSVSVRMLPVRDEEDRITGSVWIARDITDRQRREELERAGDHDSRWRSRIAQALEEDSFALAVQPILDLRNGAVDHHELLLRMRTADGEEVSPGRFIPVAERSGQIVAIDCWVARRGIELADRFPVAINISARGIASPQLAAEIERSIRRSGVDPTRVTFEITETAAVEEIDAAVRLVDRLRALGCGVSLDDFGTGFASLTYLKRLKVTELKIDYEFVANATADEADQRVINTIVSIGRNFRLQTVAEGIEDEPTRRLMRDMGVDLAQGFLLGRPRIIEPRLGRSGVPLAGYAPGERQMLSS